MSAKSKTSLTARQRAETLRRVMQWVRPYGLSVGGSLAAAALSVAAQLYIPILCGRAIDQMFGPGQVNSARGRAHCPAGGFCGGCSGSGTMAFEPVQ